MSKIFIVRHGQSTDNAQDILGGHRDSELTETGREQARVVAEKLREHDIDVIYASPLKRAYETAEIIARSNGFSQIIRDEDLKERYFGVLTGKKVADIKNYSDNFIHSDGIDYFLDAEGAEDFPSTYKRAQKVLSDIREKHPDKNVLIVTHGDIGKMIRAVYHGWSWEEGLKTPYFNNTEILELSKKDIIE